MSGPEQSGPEQSGPEQSGSPGHLLITVSATYGAGGSIVVPALAERLGLPCVQRLVMVRGADDQSTSLEHLSEAEARTIPISRLLAYLSHAVPIGPTQSPPPLSLDDDLRNASEADIRPLIEAGEGIILGRAGAVVLGRDRGFHVRLDGPSDRRIAQAAEIEGVSSDEARARMNSTDKARHAYVRRLYRADPTDASLYHLVIDSTVLPFDSVVDLIVNAARAAHSKQAHSKQAHS